MMDRMSGRLFPKGEIGEAEREVRRGICKIMIGWLIVCSMSVAYGIWAALFTAEPQSATNFIVAAAVFHYPALIFSLVGMAYAIGAFKAATQECECNRKEGSVPFSG